MNHGTLNGYNYHKCRCDACRQAMKLYDASRLEKKRSEQASRYRDNPELWQQRSKTYAENHPEKVRAMKSSWKKNRPGYYKEYYSQNSMKIRERASHRRALRTDQFIEDVDPQIVYNMHGGMCGICEEFIIGKFHIDHVIPLAKGGMHGYINVQPAHPFCNLSKGSTLLKQPQSKV